MGVFKTTTRTAVTEWIERMTSDKYKEDDFADMFELCEVINIQATGPKEASKALKHALKYGSIHTQVRAVTILKSLAENCGDKFVVQIATYKFTERLRNMATSPYTDSKVQKKLLLLFADWSTEFKNKPGYELLANLHYSTNHRSSTSNVAYASSTRGSGSKSTPSSSLSSSNFSNKEKEKEKNKEKEKYKEKEKNKSVTSRSKKGHQSEVRPVTYSSEKINEAIGLATQNATNLINALTLLSPGSDLEKDTELQELVHKCKSSSEILVKMIPTVTDNGSQLGPLLQSNDQIQGALAAYSQYIDKDEDVTDVTSGVKNIKLQKQKENDDDISGLGLNKKKSQAEEAAKIHKDFGDLIDFDAFSSNTTSNTADDDTYTDPFADPFADPVTPEPTEPVNEPKRRLGWTEV